jgi:hypothetical protein
MNRTYINETMAAAENVPAYVGWSLQGASATDGALLWGEILSAEVREIRGVPRLVVTYAHNTRGATVPNTQVVRLTTPDGKPHQLTLVKSAAFSDCRGGESVSVDTANGLEIHHGELFWHPWDDSVYGVPEH